MYVFGYPRCHWGITNCQVFSGFFCQPTRFPRLQIFGPLTGLSLEEVDSTVESQLIQPLDPLNPHNKFASLCASPFRDLPDLKLQSTGSDPFDSQQRDICTIQALTCQSSESPRVPIQASPAMAITSEKKKGKCWDQYGVLPKHVRTPRSEYLIEWAKSLIGFKIFSWDRSTPRPPSILVLTPEGGEGEK